MNLYLVWAYNGYRAKDDHDLIGVFSTKEEAEKALVETRYYHKFTNAFITERKLDEPNLPQDTWVENFINGKPLRYRRSWTT